MIVLIALNICTQIILRAGVSRPYEKQITPLYLLYERKATEKNPIHRVPGFFNLRGEIVSGLSTIQDLL